ncbi:MAG: ribonuclease J [Pseudomonadota bacterium]
MTDIQNVLPSHDDFWFLPLGGTGEIGMNLNLYGHGGAWIMVDCGSTFDVPLDQAKDSDKNAKRESVVIPNYDFAKQHKDKLVAILVTHAHEDHIGALTTIWPHLQCPIYATAFTAEIIRRKFINEELYYELPIVIIDSGEQLDIGPFNVRWISITHSMIETQSLLITTAKGTVFHTADWKMDETPILGSRFKSAKFKRLANENVLAMVCDSTNAKQPGHTESEADCAAGLQKLIQKQHGRVVVSCFSSNLARLVTLIKIANNTGRYVSLFGRAMENMVSAARTVGIWPDELSTIPNRHIGYLPKEEVMIIATGSQGENNAALDKFSRRANRHCDLDAGDTVIFSSVIIPGNERSIEKLISRLQQLSINVFHDATFDDCIHASGHPRQQDLFDMYRWVKPNYAVPTHGEVSHMALNASISYAAGVSQHLTGVNGDLFCLTPEFKKIDNLVQTGRIAQKR